MQSSVALVLFLLLSPAEPNGKYPFGRLNERAPKETAHWGRLAGIWDCTIESIEEDGTRTVAKATWTWTYILDGYAVRDVYVGEPREGRHTFYGTGLRVYNAAREKWEIAWIANADSGKMNVTLFEATSRDGEVVMRYPNGAKPSWRTVFSDIAEDSFEWRSEPSGQKMRCERQRALANAARPMR